MDVASWLRTLGLERYEAAFRENDVGVDVLSDLTAEDLEALGVVAVGHRRRLLVAIAKLRDDAASPRTVSSPNDLRPSAPERRQITVLFCDIVGSTPLSTGLDPEELRELLTAYQTNVGAAVAAEHGYIARFVGDGVLAYFGWPNADETHAESAVRAGLAMIAAVRPQQLSVRIGIATGLVLTGDLLGVGAAQTMTAVGETPNLAARLQALAQPDTIVVSEATRSQLGQMFEVEDLGSHTLKGFDTPVTPWRVLRKSAAISRSEVVYASALTPLIGRDEELGLLLRRWQEAKIGDGHVVLLTGEAGIGKSRLLAALEERLAGEPHNSLRYFCSPHHQDSPLYPLIARLEREAGFIQGDTLADRLTKLEAILAPTRPAPEDIVLLAALLSIPAGGRYPALELSPQQQKTRTFAALLRRLSALARNNPLLLLFEDAHWSDPSSVELLEAVVEQVPDLPVLLVVSFRPEFVPPWFGRARVSLMALGRLDRRDATSLAIQIVNNHVLSSPLLDRIVTQCDGVPLFIEELTRAVLEAPEFDTAGATLAVPNTLQASLKARLDRLPAANTVAQIGSVIGREFSQMLLAAAAGQQAAQLTEGLTQLVAAGLVFKRGVPPETVYQFKHALVRDVAYGSLPKAARQRLHRNIGEAMRDQLADQAEVEPEVVAYHFAQAGLNEAAITWGQKAAALAMQRSAFAEAIAHIENALDLANVLDGTREQRFSHLRLKISHAYTLRVGRGAAASETKVAFAQASELARTIGDVPGRIDADFGLWTASVISGDLVMARELAETFPHDVERWSNLPGAGLAHRVHGVTGYLTGDFISARRYLELACANYDSKRDRPLADHFGQDLAVPPMAFLALTLWSLGMGESARRMIEELITHALGTRHIPTIVFAHQSAAIFEMLRRDYQLSANHLQVYIELTREHGMRRPLAISTFYEGWMRWVAGAHESGAEHMHEGLEQIRKQGTWIFAPLYGVLLAETEAVAGRNKVAVAIVDAELATMTQTGQCWFLAEGHRVRGELLLISNPADTEAAEAAFTQAIEVARGQSAKRFELRAAMLLARLWRGQGKRDEHNGLLSVLAEGLPDGSDLDGFSEMQVPAR